MRKEMLGRARLAKIAAFLIGSVALVICGFVRTEESNCDR